MAERPDHRALAAEIHQINVEAGWWTNIQTMEPLDRNFGEMLALVHSELSECWEGIATKRFDDHIPILPNWHVELADACIRAYDMLGGCFKDNISFSPYALDMPEGFLSVEDRLVFLHLLLSQSLEHWRKSRKAEAKMYLVRFLDCCFEWAYEAGWDLLNIIQLKCAYNRERIDHKIESRQAPDGKKI